MAAFTVEFACSITNRDPSDRVDTSVNQHTMASI
ncbi:Uncharacterised protein [Mycobacteroides abscessus subsp. abscessus]|nr:Uncharacterised protein [Mycobacteroides abscessus subsp. abscessus]